MLANFGLNSLGVRSKPGARDHAGVKIAVRAAGLAERDLNVDAEAHEVNQNFSTPNVRDLRAKMAGDGAIAFKRRPPQRAAATVRGGNKRRLARTHCESAGWIRSTRTLIFDNRAEAVERSVPLPRYLIKIGARVRQALRIEPPASFAAVARAENQTGTLHDAQVLRNCLARDFGAGREPGDGHWPLPTQASHQAQSRVVSQCREEGRPDFWQGDCHVLTDSSQDIPR